MARFASVAELAAFLSKLDPDYAQHELHCGRRVSGLHSTLQTSVSYITSTVTCQGCTLVISKQELIVQVSR